MERSIRLTPLQEELIERMGVFIEQKGTSPAESRILALLMVCDITELTFEEIYQALKISKSAASNAISRLLTISKIDYITKPGDRKRYFRSKMKHWEDNFKENFEKVYPVAELMQEILDQRPETDVEFNKTLGNLIAFIHFMQSEIPLLYQKWKKQSEKSGK